jgi:hypothetical protein
VPLPYDILTVFIKNNVEAFHGTSLQMVTHIAPYIYAMGNADLAYIVVGKAVEEEVKGVVT